MYELQEQITETEHKLSDVRGKLAKASTKYSDLQDQLTDVGLEFTQANVAFSIDAQEETGKTIQVLREQKLSITNGIIRVKDSLNFLRQAIDHISLELESLESQLTIENRNRVNPVANQLLPAATLEAQRAMARYTVLKAMTTGVPTDSIDTLNKSLTMIFRRDHEYLEIMRSIVDEIRDDHNLGDAVI